MFDDLRNSEQPIFQGEEIKKTKPDFSMPNRPAAKKKKNKKFLGMTAIQRFVLSTLLFMVVCVLGVMVLFFTGKMMPLF